MRLAISNIAWDVALDDEIAQFLQAAGVRAVELAPTKYWPAPCAPKLSEVGIVRKQWEDRGQSIVALQSLLFGCPDMSIFGDDAVRQRTAAYLAAMIDITHELGATTLVFGSPKNRDRGNLANDVAVAVAVEFFRPLAERAAAAGCVVAFEPNPVRYGCNFCTTTREAFDFVRAVSHPGLKLNLDLGIMHINQEPIADTIRAVRPAIAHVHISEPELAGIGNGDTPHALAAEALKLADWQGNVSIEMRAPSGGVSALEQVKSAVAVAGRIYC